MRNIYKDLKVKYNMESSQNLRKKTKRTLIGCICLLEKIIFVGLLGWGIYFPIFLISNSVNYSLFASSAISGILWYLLPDFFKSYFEYEK